MEIYEIMKNIPPNFKKGRRLAFDKEQGQVYMIDNDNIAKYPI